MEDIPLDNYFSNASISMPEEVWRPLSAILAIEVCFLIMICLVFAEGAIPKEVIIE